MNTRAFKVAVTRLTPLCSALTLALALASPAQAQQSPSPSRVTPESAAPTPPPAETAITLPETRVSTAPAGSENLAVTLGQIEVAGGDPDLAPAIAALTAPYAGRRVSMAQLYAVAGQIEALYVRRGEVLTRATVPPQHLTDGATFRIAIVEGFIEAVDVSAVPPSVRKAVAARAGGLVGQRGLSMAQIERRVLLAGQVPGTRLESTLVPGQQIGGAVLVLKAAWQPVNASLGVDNHLGDAYRTWNFDAQVVLNSVLGMGEQIYGLASTTSDFNLFSGAPMRRIAGAGMIVPLGSDGLSLNGEYLRADTNPRAPAGAVAVRGRYEAVAARLRYPSILSRRESLNLEASLTLQDERQAAPMFALQLSHDRLRVAGLRLDWTKATRGGVVIGSGLAFAQGINGLGARTAADAARSGVPFSRQGSGPDFTKLGGSFSLRAALGQGVELAVLARGQASLSGALPSSAQFSLDAPDGLSGFDLGTLNADSGLTARAELAHPISAGTVTLAPYLFGATGLGALAQPTVLERGTMSGWSLGGGLRGNLGPHITFAAELSRNHASPFARDQTRLMASLGLHY